MRSIIKILFLVSVLVYGCSLSVSGQSKKEQKQYLKAVKTGTLESYQKFLDKFPASVYLSDVNHFIDSIHYSKVNLDDMASCMTFMSEYPDSEFIPELVDGVYKMAINQRYVQDNSLGFFKELKGFEEYEFAGNKYYFYSFMNLPQGAGGELLPGMVCEYVVNLLDRKSGAIHSSMFSGKVIPSSDNTLEYLIEGDYMDDDAAGPYMTAEGGHLLSLLREDKRLLPISDGDVMTDQAISWWLANNKPKARVLKFGLLPQESSLVEGFKNQKEYERKGSYQVALFDIRGYTVIVSYEKASGQYVLVWAEPVCKDKKVDPLLNTIYFENNNSLVLYYYEGRTTYKVRVNMANKAITR